MFTEAFLLFTSDIMHGTEKQDQRKIAISLTCHYD